MKKTLFIVLAMIGVGSLCATEPIDDVYYWPEVKSQKAEKAVSQEPAAAEPEQQKVESQETSEHEPLQVEYVNVQDTTVTIRVK